MSLRTTPLGRRSSPFPTHAPSLEEEESPEAAATEVVAEAADAAAAISRLCACAAVASMECLFSFSLARPVTKSLMIMMMDRLNLR